MRCEFHPEAEVDLMETILYYETQAPGLGERFAAEVQHAIEQLLIHPQIGVSDKEGFRKWVLATFPYNLRYTENDQLVSYPVHLGSSVPLLAPREPMAVSLHHEH